MDQLVVGILEMKMDDLVTCNSIIGACSSALQWAQAVQLLQRCRWKPNVVTFNAVISACVERWWMVTELLEQMELQMVKKDAPRRTLGAA
eukprot:Skav211688  [mRNA]  locus=scaffold216:547216:547832:- [translate_table: standard]